MINGPINAAKIMCGIRGMVVHAGPLWHYTVVLWMLRDGFLGSPRFVGDSECVVDDLLAGFGAGGFANMDDALPKQSCGVSVGYRV